MPPITVRGVGAEAKGEHLLATFTLSEAPGQQWVQFFKERASASVLGNRCSDVPAQSALH